MATDTLQEYEALLESGFSEQQARALVRLITPSRTDPEVLNRLDQISQQLNAHSQILDQHSQILGQHSRLLEAMLPLVQTIPAMAEDLRKLNKDVSTMQVEQGETRAELRVIEERVKLESRVSRMINATLIALGAIAASLVAAFAR